MLTQKDTHRKFDVPSAQYVHETEREADTECNRFNGVPDPQAATIIDATILLVPSCAMGFCVAVIGALLGSGLIQFFLLYFAVSMATWIGFLLVALLRHRMNDARSDPNDTTTEMIEYNVNEAAQKIFKQNRRIRLWFLFFGCVVVFTMVLSDEPVVLAGVIATCLATLSWLFHRRHRVLSGHIRTVSADSTGPVRHARREKAK